jgi:hypothetical protein
MELTEKVAQTTAADNEETPVTVANEESSAITATGNVEQNGSQPMQLFRITSISKNALTKDDSIGLPLPQKMLTTLNGRPQLFFDTKSKNKYNGFVLMPKRMSNT